MEQPESPNRIRSSELVLPQPDEPCPLCEAKGWRWIMRLERYGVMVKELCCDCEGKGRRPARQNAPAHRRRTEDSEQ